MPTAVHAWRKSHSSLRSIEKSRRRCSQTLPSFLRSSLEKTRESGTRRGLHSLYTNPSIHRFQACSGVLAPPCIIIPGCVTLSPPAHAYLLNVQACAPIPSQAWRRSELPALSGCLSTLFRLRPLTPQQHNQPHLPSSLTSPHLSHPRGLASLSSLSSLWLWQTKSGYLCLAAIVTAREASSRASSENQATNKGKNLGNAAGRSTLFHCHPVSYSPRLSTSSWSSFTVRLILWSRGVALAIIRFFRHRSPI